MHLWSLWAKYWHLWPIWSHARPKNNANKMPRWFSLYLGTKIWVPKKAKFGQKYAFLGTYMLCWFIWCPVGWWLWRAGCISQDTFLLYVLHVIMALCSTRFFTTWCPSLQRWKLVTGLCQLWHHFWRHCPSFIPKHSSALNISWSVLAIPFSTPDISFCSELSRRPTSSLDVPLFSQLPLVALL